MTLTRILLTTISTPIEEERANSPRVRRYVWVMQNVMSRVYQKKCSCVRHARRVHDGSPIGAHVHRPHFLIRPQYGPALAMIR
jgi:hypothetical protein